jgi:hypothetical protein
MAWNGEFINGMTQGFLAPRGYFMTKKAEEETAKIADLGLNYVALVVNQFQETFASTRIFADNRRTVSDRELIVQIERLHRAGIKVMLKPMIEPLDSLWRGFIRHAAGNIIAETVTDNVALWFASYHEFLRRYAEIAEETGCELFCLGCELDGMEGHPAEWRAAIALVRSIYRGPVTHNITMNITGFTDERRWLADLDLVGVSGYFKVAPPDRSATFEEMCEGWKIWSEKLARFAAWLDRPLFFAETGARPVVGAAGITGDFQTSAPTYSETEQADYYRSTLAVLGGEPWFRGSMWWKWDEHQHRPHYFLPDGHYVGCEPAPALQNAMRAWCKR